MDTDNVAKETRAAPDDNASKKPITNDQKDTTENRAASSKTLPPEITDDGTVSFSLSGVHEHLICSLCSGYYKEPYTVTDCLHTFCKSCLCYAVASGCYECPECHLYLGSDPLKAATLDNTLQELIDNVIFPDLVKQEEEEEREFYKKRGMKLKSKGLTKRQRPEMIRLRNTPPEKKIQGDEIEFLIFPERVSDGEQLQQLERPLLQVSGKLKMNQLKKYIVQSLQLPPKYKLLIEILCNGVPVGDEISLGFINRLLWPYDSCLELTYLATKGDC